MTPKPIQNKLNKKLDLAKIILILPLLLASIFLGGFGGSIVYGVNEVSSKIATFAAVNLGYGCGGYGQSAPATSTTVSSPTYGNACLQQLTTSSSTSAVVTSSSQAVTSSSVASSTSSSSSTTTSSTPTSASSSSTSTSTSSTTSTNQTNLNLKVNLSGGYSDTNDSNSTTLRTGNKLPLSQPYNVAPWSYTGNESVSTASDIPTNTTDWVLVEIKDASGASLLKKAGFLLGNGNVVDTTTGSTSLSLGNLATGNYKVVVRHRNHIAIATDVNVTLTASASTTVDLTKNVNVKASNQVLVGTDTNNSNIFGMRNSNVNGDGVINAVDKGTARLAGATTLYSNNDVNLDGVVNATDKGTVRLAGAAAENL